MLFVLDDGVGGINDGPANTAGSSPGWEATVLAEMAPRVIRSFLDVFASSERTVATDHAHPADLKVENGSHYNLGWWVEGDGSIFATTGDSGSILVDEDRRVVDMVVAVNRETGFAFVHGIKQIFTALQIALL